MTRIPESVLRAMLHEMGVTCKVFALPADPITEVIISMPSFGARFELDDEAGAGASSSANLAVRIAQGSVRTMFRSVIDHIAKHDRSPLSRMEQMEKLAAKMLPENEQHDSGDQREMRHLLRSKTGAVSWAPNGYGEDPK